MSHWNCALCTLQNSDADAACRVCATDRPRSSAKRLPTDNRESPDKKKQARLHSFFAPSSSATAKGGFDERFSGTQRTMRVLHGASVRPPWFVFDSTLLVRGRASSSEFKLAQCKRVAAFDFDGCLVPSAHFGRGSGPLKFPQHFLFDRVPVVLQKLADNGFHLAILTNEAIVGRMKKPQAIQNAVDKKVQRLEAFLGALDVPVDVLCATAYDRYRKASSKAFSRSRNAGIGGVGMWQVLRDQLNQAPCGVSIQESFFVGDAAGRPGDFSDSDKQFARAAGLRFFTPEDIFHATDNELENLLMNGKPPSIPSSSSPSSLSAAASSEATRVFPPLPPPAPVPRDATFRAQKQVVVLMGLQGSGKTTLGERLVLSFGSERCVRFSQDVLKNRGKVERAVGDALSTDGGPRVVLVDRTNVSAEQRGHWVNIAKLHGARCMATVLGTPANDCVARLMVRTDHEGKGLPTGEANAGKLHRIVRMFKNKWEDVDAATEGFDEVVHVKSAAEEHLVIDQLVLAQSNRGNDASSTAGIGAASAAVADTWTPSSPASASASASGGSGGAGSKTESSAATLASKHVTVQFPRPLPSTPTLRFVPISADVFAPPPAALDASSAASHAAKVLVSSVLGWLADHPTLDVLVHLVEPGPGQRGKAVLQIMEHVSDLLNKHDAVDTRFQASQGLIVGPGEPSVHSVAVGCMSRFKCGGDAANVALHKACEITGGKGVLFKAARAAMDERGVGLAMPGYAYVHALPDSLGTAIGAASVIHVLGPNMNPSLPGFVEDKAEAESLLRRAYRSMLDAFAEVVTGSLPAAPASAAASSPKEFPLPSVPAYIPPQGQPRPAAGGWTRALRQFCGEDMGASASSPSSVFLRAPELQAVVIYDAFAKAKVHLLVLPLPSCSARVDSIRLLGKQHLEGVRQLHRLAQHVALQLCKSDPQLQLRIGYHAVPSLEPLHIHIISQDFDSPALKNKKHWNSLTHPGFFLDAVVVEHQLQEDGKVTSAQDTHRVEALLKQDMLCHRCGVLLPNIPKLKEHLTRCAAGPVVREAKELFGLGAKNHDPTRGE